MASQPMKIQDFRAKSPLFICSGRMIDTSFSNPHMAVIKKNLDISYFFVTALILILNTPSDTVEPFTFMNYFNF